MRIGVPVFKGRVAPRCTIAEGLLVVTVKRGRVTNRRFIPPGGSNWFDFVSQVLQLRVSTLVCGGISREQKDSLTVKNIDVIDNVACSVEEVLGAITKDKLQAGFGFRTPESESDDAGHVPDRAEYAAGDSRVIAYHRRPIDCLSCSRPVCLQGKACDAMTAGHDGDGDPVTRQLLESARDITFEQERTLCRLSELIYFGLEMKYRRLGLAYCTDLMEPSRILTDALRRYFEVIPVCCKVGGVVLEEPGFVVDRRAASGPQPVTCNPLGQARALNEAGTDFNVAVGLCVGVDSIFAQASDAPVSTLFVKDKSLANNPIGALYSEYYLREAAGAPFART